MGKIQYKSNLQAVIETMNFMYQDNVNEACEYLKESMQETLSHEGSGRMYGSHRASAPNEPPAPDTWQLHNSVECSVEVVKGKIHGQLTVTDPKAIHLEFGTVRMAKRPFFKVTYTKEREKLKSILRKRGVKL